MREMKNSGIEWIGEIPADWKTMHFKIAVASLNSGKSLEKNIEEGTYPIYGGGNIIGFCNQYNTKSTALIIGRVGARCGCVSMPKCKVWATDNALILYVNDKMYLPFTYFILVAAELNRLNESSAQPLITGEKIKKLIIPFPSLPEQRKIAAYLDKKCGSIDSLTQTITAQIETLEQYKRSVITETVTKGLDPDAEMKDSGIEWIGKIPADWDTTRIKDLFDIVSGSTPSAELDNWDGDIYWITPADYKTIDKYVSKGKRNLSAKGYESCSTMLVPVGSLIFSKRAPIGSVAITSEILCTNQGCLACVPKDDCCINYYYYLLSIGTEHFELLGAGTTFKEISLKNFSNCKLPFPTKDRRYKIAAYLDKKCGAIDNLIQTKQDQLATLDEYKKSLIYEYVTGKKEVPSA